MTFVLANSDLHIDNASIDDHNSTAPVPADATDTGKNNETDYPGF